MGKFGFGKGSPSEAAQEALLRWIWEVGEAPPEIGSVELQHRAGELWGLRDIAPDRR